MPFGFKAPKLPFGGKEETKAPPPPKPQGDGPPWESGRLSVEVLGARGLRAADKSGTSDPFVCVQLVANGKPLPKPHDKSHKTRTIKKTLAPRYKDENFVFDDVPLQTLRFRVYDWNAGLMGVGSGKPKPLGEASVDLAQRWAAQPDAGTLVEFFQPTIDAAENVQATGLEYAELAEEQNVTSAADVTEEKVLVFVRKMAETLLRQGRGLEPGREMNTARPQLAAYPIRPVPAQQRRAARLGHPAAARLDDNEIRTFSTVGKSRYLAELLVTCTQTGTGNKCMVMECAPQFSLDHVLNKAVEDDTDVSNLVLMQICMQVEEGMEHLHLHSIVHCDLALRNILVFFYPHNWKRLLVK